jgi:fatty-acyl-CoA synthase
VTNVDISFFIRQCFGDVSRCRPDAPALGLEHQPPLSFRVLAQRTWSYANALAQLGVGVGDRVGILLYNSVEYWLAYFAITRLGAIAVRLNFRLSPDELKYALVDSGASVLLGEAELLAPLEDRRGALPVRHFIARDGGEPGMAWARRWRELEQGSSSEPDLPLPAPEMGAMLMYTSGTTGRPKGALWSHANTTWWAAMQIMEWGFTPDTVTMVTGPLYHVGSIENYALPTLAAGGRVVLLRSRGFELERTLRIASEEQVTDLLLFPSMIHELLQRPELWSIDLSRVRRMFTGGDILFAGVAEQMQERFGWIDIVQVYGLTEGTPIAVCGAPGSARPDAIGRAFPFVEVSVRDEAGTPLAPGVEGEIWTRSPANSLGYWSRPEETAATFVGGWCRTGDQGTVEGGMLRIIGRKKDMIRSGGENIYPAEIENVLARHPKIAAAAVIGLPDPTFIESVCAVIVPVDGEELTAEEVVEYCSRHLAAYKKPRRVEFVTELPMTPSLKVMKTALREQFGAA